MADIVKSVEENQEVNTLLDIDRLLELYRLDRRHYPDFLHGLTNEENQEYQSLYEKLKKAEEFWVKIQAIFPVSEWNYLDSCIKTIDLLLQNQKLEVKK